MVDYLMLKPHRTNAPRSTNFFLVCFGFAPPSPPGLTSSTFVGDLENTVTHGNERGREAEARQSPDALARCQMATRPPPPLRSGRPVSHTPPSWTPTSTCTPLFFSSPPKTPKT
jgi:hypothetical protein